MDTKGWLTRGSFLQLGVGVACTLILREGNAAEPLVIVVAQTSALKELSLQDLQRLYRGDINSLQGKRMLPLNHLPRSEPREHFDQRVLGMNAEETARYWIDRRIRGQSGAPKSVPARLMAAVVAKLPNSIGYVSAGSADAALTVLRVNGKLPGEPGYPIF